MLNRKTFAQICADVRQEVLPAGPTLTEIIASLGGLYQRFRTPQEVHDLAVAEFLKQHAERAARNARLYGWQRADGSETGIPADGSGQPHGERAARRVSHERHIRMVPRHDKDAALAGIARYEGRSKKRLFSRPPFTPRFMRKNPAVAPSARVIAGNSTVTRVTPVGISPVTETYQQELRETCRRACRTARFAIETPLATRPRQPWRPAPVRPPVALCSSARVLYVETRM